MAWGSPEAGGLPAGLCGFTQDLLLRVRCEGLGLTTSRFVVQCIDGTRKTLMRPSPITFSSGSC